MPTPTGSLATIMAHVDRGDYFAALGLAPGARRLDIDVAVARLAQGYPDHARLFQGIERVLTKADARRGYDAVCVVRQDVIHDLIGRGGEALLDTARRAWIWSECCKLLRFDVQQGGSGLGPAGLRSVARRGPAWIAESFLATWLTPVSVTERERREGAAVREFWFASCRTCGRRQLSSCRRRDDRYPPSRERPGLTEAGRVRFQPQDYAFFDHLLPGCPHCGGRMEPPSRFEGTYRFAFPPRVASGSLITGTGDADGTRIFAVAGTISPTRDRARLRQFYDLQCQGQDVSFDQVTSPADTGPHGAVAGDLGRWPAIMVVIVGAVLGLCLSLIKPTHHSPTPTRAPGSPPARTPTKEETQRHRVWMAEIKAGLSETLAERFPEGPGPSMGIALARGELAEALLAAGRREEAGQTLTEAIEVLRPVVASHPDQPEYRAHLVRLHDRLAHVYRREDRHVDALARWQQAADHLVELVATQPPDLARQFKLATIRSNLAINLARTGRLEEAWQSVTLAGSSLDALTPEELNDETRAGAVGKIRRTEAGICNHYAWHLSTRKDDSGRNGRRAVEIATRACELTEWSQASYVDTLAAAYAAAGDFEAAVKWQQDAINAAPPDRREPLAARLALYRDRQPYHAPAGAAHDAASGAQGSASDNH